jgi:putative FmdB family regulatory protein
MPKYVFECPSCDLRFTRALKMGEHPEHTCPNCGGKAPRQWNGQGFGFDFAEGDTPGNSGVSKQDYPTADQAVGRSADQRWEEYAEREKVKEKVREVTGHRAIRRAHGPGNTHIEYQQGGQGIVEGRKQLAQEVNQRLLAEAETNG